MVAEASYCILTMPNVVLRWVQAIPAKPGARLGQAGGARRAKEHGMEEPGGVRRAQESSGWPRKAHGGPREA